MKWLNTKRLSLFVPMFGASLMLCMMSFTVNAQQQTDTEHIIRFKLPPSQQLEVISRLVSIDQVKDGWVRAYTLDPGISILQEYGIDYETLPHPSEISATCMADAIALPDSTWDFYPTYSAYVDLMYQFQYMYPELCRIEEIGTLSSGRKLLAAVISKNIDSTELEPRFLYTSSMHGDELVGYVLMLRLINHLLTLYNIDPLVTKLVDGLEIWINPLANPDGTYASGNSTVSGARRSNGNWVDLNRNFPDPQHGPHPDNKPWQQETLLFMALANAQQFNASSNIHGGAEVCNYPWDTWSHLPADNNWWLMVCHQYADSAQCYGPSGYFNDFITGVTNGYAWYSISGGRQDYMNYFHRCREFTLEISQNKLPAASSLPGFWNANYRSLLRYMEQACHGLQGRVYDSVSKHALPAMVYIHGHDMDSSHVRTRLPLGDYYRYLSPGNYDITYTSPGYITSTMMDVSIINGQRTIQDVALLAASSNIYDKHPDVPTLVYDRLSHRLISNGEHSVIRAELFDTGGRLVWSKNRTTTASNADMNLPQDLRPGLYIARVLIEQGAAGWQPLVVKCIVD